MGFSNPNKDDMLQTKETTNFVHIQGCMDTMHFRKNCNVPLSAQVSLIAQTLLTRASQLLQITVPLSFSKAFWDTKRKSEATC